MTLSSEEIEGFIHDLQPETTPFVGERVYAATSLGKVEFSTLPIIQALLTAMESDPDAVVRKRACRSLFAAVHQAVMIDYPDVQARCLEAQPALGVDVSESHTLDTPEEMSVVPHYPARRSTSVLRRSVQPLHREDFIYDVVDDAANHVASSVMAYVVGVLIFVVLICYGSIFAP